MRGQLDYSFYLVLVVLIASGVLVAQLGNKLEFSRGMGDVQGAVLAVNNDVALLDVFVRKASQEVIAGVLTDSRRDAGLFFPFVDEDSGCAVVNDAADPTVLFVPDIAGRLSERVSAGLRPYLASLEEQSQWEVPGPFAVGIEPGSFVVSALRPAMIDVLDSGGVNVGEAGHRVVVRVPYAHKLDEFARSLAQLERVARACSYQENPAGCAAGLMPNWEPSEWDDARVIFIAEAAREQPCYLLYLPKGIPAESIT